MTNHTLPFVYTRNRASLKLNDKQTNKKMGGAGSTGYPKAATVTEPSPPLSAPHLLLSAQHVPPSPLPGPVAALVASSGHLFLGGESPFSQLIGFISQLPKGNFLEKECGLALLFELDQHPASITQNQLMDSYLWLVCPPGHNQW